MACRSACGAARRGDRVPVISANSSPTSIAPGPEGNEWFTEKSGNRIGRITPAGAVTEFPIPTPASEPSGIALGPEGNLWFTEYKGNKIGRITPAGVITEFPLPTAERGPLGIAAGSDGTLWFTEYGIGATQGQGGAIGRITTAGAIGEYATPTPESGPFAITGGPDGNLWFTEPSKGNVGRLVPSSFSFNEFHVSGGGPHDIAPGPDGNVWFTEEGSSKIGRITPSGTTVTLVSLEANSRPNGIAPGPDGALWFTENAQQKVIVEGKEETIEVSRVGRITPSGELELFPTHVLESGPEGIAPGADGNLYFTEASRNNIGLVGTGVAGPLLGPPVVSGNHEAGSPQTCSASWASWASLQPSAALFGFDGYQWLLNGTLVATGAMYTPTKANIGYPLACTEVVTYPLLDVTTGAASAAATVIPPPPTLASFQQSKAKWREGKKLAHISLAGKRGRRGHGHKHRKPKPPVGTTFAFTLSEEAGVKFTFTHSVSGREVAHKCVAKTHRNRKHKGCHRVVTAGVLSFTGHEGVNHVRFEGRISVTTKLKPGPYTLTIAAANTTGPATPATLHFTIVK